jgi:phosphatidylglycerol:prolipoprotein diacylglycerol transferase
MLTYPNISPVALSLGPLTIYWYGIMYLIGFLCAYGLGVYRKERLGFTNEDVSDLIFYGAMGVVLGGRTGYMFFYHPDFLWASPLSLFKVWDGGMSFHGGLIGVILAFILFAKKKALNFWLLADFIAPFVPVGLFFGRIGNFINGELWGRVTDMPWGMIFPLGDQYPRHPSQLYEAFFEGIILFLILWCFSKKERPKGRVSALFLIGYGVIRLSLECFREPDPQLGFIGFNVFTMGQLLSIPMIIAGLVIWKNIK